jgi:hypothetical protein
MTSFLIAALTQPQPDLLWIGASVCFVVALIGALGWLLTREDARPKPTVNADADNQSTAIAVGGDLKMRDLYMAPPAAPNVARATPSFALTHQIAPDGWVHLLLSNYSDPAEFHIDVIDVQGARDYQHALYSVKWRGSPAEDRRVIKEALIDLAQVHFPEPPDDDSSILFVRTGSYHKKGNWYSGSFRLVSFSEPEGWTVDAEERSYQGANAMPDALTLYLEQITLTLRAVRIDSSEEMMASVEIGFEQPTWSVEGNRWMKPPHMVRVRVETKPTPQSSGETADCQPQ